MKDNVTQHQILWLRVLVPGTSIYDITLRNRRVGTGLLNGHDAVRVVFRADSALLIRLARNKPLSD